MRCHYCGVGLTYKTATVDHVKARSRGGNNKRSNRVDACGSCNSIKGPRPIELARPNLIQKMIGWPKFNAAQIAWLRGKGFDLSEFDNAKLAFERDEIFRDE